MTSQNHFFFLSPHKITAHDNLEAARDAQAQFTPGDGPCLEDKQVEFAAKTREATAAAVMLALGNINAGQRKRQIQKDATSALTKNQDFVKLAEAWAGSRLHVRGAF